MRVVIGWRVCFRRLAVNSAILGIFLSYNPHDLIFLRENAPIFGLRPISAASELVQLISAVKRQKRVTNIFCKIEILVPFDSSR